MFETFTDLRRLSGRDGGSQSGVAHVMEMTEIGCIWISCDCIFLSSSSNVDGRSCRRFDLDMCAHRVKVYLGSVSVSFSAHILFGFQSPFLHILVLISLERRTFRLAVFFASRPVSVEVARRLDVIPHMVYTAGYKPLCLFAQANSSVFLTTTGC